jgi:hypothetical protein
VPVAGLSVAALEAVARPERARARQIFELAVQCVSERMWAAIFHSSTLPDLFSLALSEDPVLAARGMAQCKKMWENVKKALAIPEKDRPPVLSHCLKEMAFHKYTLVREIVAQAEKSEWNHMCPELRHQLMCTFAVPGNTKFLEDS